VFENYKIQKKNGSDKFQNDNGCCQITCFIFKKYLLESILKGEGNRYPREDQSLDMGVSFLNWEQVNST